MKSRPDIVYQNACVNVLVIDKLLTDKNKKKYPSENYFNWTPLESAANLLKMWSLGEHRPENGELVGFETEKKGKVIFPKFY